MMGQKGVKFDAKGVGVGIAVGIGTEKVKDALGQHDQNENAGAITAEILTTGAVNTGLTTMIMAASGSIFNPVAAGIGFATAGGMAAGQAIYKASEGTGIQRYPTYGNSPRYNRDLNGIPSVDMLPGALPGATFEGNLIECATEAGNCSFTGARTVRYGTVGAYITKSAVGAALHERSLRTRSGAQRCKDMPISMSQRKNW